MKHLSLTGLILALPLLPAAAQAEDILSIMARNAEMQPRVAPETIDYSYTLTLDVKERDGKELHEGQAVLRIDPTRPPGSRAQIISASDPENEALQNFLKEVEDEDNTLKKQAEGFWCGSNDAASNSDFDPENYIVVSENAAQAVLKPTPAALAELLLQSDENAEDNGRKMMKKLVKRIDGNVTLSKPSGEMKGFSVKMTRPMTMMLVAKLKVMDVSQSCTLAPNGHYRIDRFKMNVEGKALGSRFGQELDMQISDLVPL